MLVQQFRPFSFEDIVGQKGIINEMKTRSETMDFPGVMIFAGPSGVGKTTLAFIIASLINDPYPLKVRGQKYKNPNPDSPASKSVLNERFNRDIKFYDASSMGKADIHELENVLSTAPMYDSNKVIIIDEAQEISKAGKGAALKLLEKKRKNSYIILCTMNIESFDTAIKSRGQKYTFRSPPSLEIAEYLFNLTGKISKDIPEDFLETGLFTISENCEGSVREATQNLERCLMGGFYTEEQIAQELGFISNERLTRLILKLLNKKSEAIPEILDFSASEFFYKAKKTLIDASIYLNTGYISADWKKNFANNVSKFDLNPLISIFIKLSNDSYFKEDNFLYELGNYLKMPKRQKI